MNKTVKIAASQLKVGDTVQVGKSRIKKTVQKIIRFESADSEQFLIDGVIHFLMTGKFTKYVLIQYADKRSCTGLNTARLKETDEIAVYQ